MTKTSPEEAGFTLLELVLAITIASLLVGMLYGALRLGYRAQEKGMDSAEASQRMRIVADRVAWLLAGAYPYKTPPTEEGAPERYLFTGKPDTLEFVTSSTDPMDLSLANRGGLMAVRLFVDNEGLKVAERLFFLQSKGEFERVYLLEPAARRLSLEYFDLPPAEEATEETGEEGQWVGAWDTSEFNYLPSAVKATIELKAPEGQKPIVMPPITVALMAAGREGPGMRIPPLTELTAPTPSR